MARRGDGDTIEVGPISDASGVAIGRGARAYGGNINHTAVSQVDPEALRAALTELWSALGAAGLPVGAAMAAQTAAGTALQAGVKDGKVDPDAVLANVQKVGETLTQANVAVEEGSSLWSSVQKLAPLLGPVVGGAQIVLEWFGIPLPA